MSFQSVREHRLAFIPVVYSGRFLWRAVGLDINGGKL